MTNRRYNYPIIVLLTVTIIILSFSCSRDIEDLGIATYPTTAEIFIDGFSAGLEYDAFGTSKVTAFSVDNKEKYKGSASMRFDVPAPNDPLGGYAAGIFSTEDGRDLRAYNALTFWAKASQTATVSEMGFGFTFDEEKYRATVKDVAISTNWSKIVIPIPDASKLNPEKGLFYYVDSPDNGVGYTFWVDEVKFENLGTIAYKQPKIFNGDDRVESTVNGSSVSIDGLSVDFNLPIGIDQTVNAAAAYFTFASSNENVATVNEMGIVTVLSEGSAVITAKVGDIDAEGSLTIASIGEFIHAPTPTHDPANVISLFSNAYSNVPVDYYNGFWAPYQTTKSADFTVNGDDILNYTNFNFVGTEFNSPPVNASNMTHLHLDLWIPNEVTGSEEFQIRILDLAESSTSMTFTSPTPLVSQSWIGLDISLSGLASKDQLFQIIYDGLGSSLSGFYVDNLYFYNDGGGTGATEPTEAAPDPTHASADVISVFSDAYTNIGISELNPNWGQSGTVDEVSIAGNNTLKYSNFNFQGTQFAMAEDMSGMEFVHIDMWTADATDVKFSPVSAGGSELLVGLTPINSGQWTGYDIPLSDFTGIPFNEILQMKFDGTMGVNPSNIWLDNIYFYKTGGTSGTEPTEPAPDPMHAAADVISVFSDAYTNIGISELNPNWGQSGTVDEVSIVGNNTLKYSNFNYQGTQFAMAEDMSGMEFVHIDMWTADATDVKFSPVSAGGSELLVGLTPINSGQWTGYDIPLSDFTGVPFNEILQMKFDGTMGVNPSNIWLDNIYFYKTGSTGGTEPTEPAPDPTHASADVISVFSDAYTNIGISELNPNWGQSGTVDEVSIVGNNTLKYSNFNYQGTQFAMAEDMSGMEFVHIDMWTADATDVKFSPVSAGGSELLVGLTPINSGQWTGYDIPLSDFTGVPFNEILQMKFDGTMGVNPSNIWLDNIYFYKTGGGGGDDYTLDSPIDFEPSGFGAGWTWSVFENDTNPPVEIVANPDPSGVNTSSTVAKITALQVGQPWVGCETTHGTDFTTFTLDESNAIVKIMVYKSVISDVGLKFVLPSGEALEEIKVANTLINQWEELSFDFSSRIGHPATIGQDQIVVFPDFDLGGRMSDNVVYFDNITFSAQSGGGSEPTQAAPAPTQDAADVISVFSDAYTNIGISNLNPGWGQSGTVEEVNISGNNTLKYGNFNYQGTEFAMPEDLSGMEFVHIDMWTADATDVQFTPISASSTPPEFLVGLTPINSGQWVSYDIPLADFMGVGFSDIFQMKFDGTMGVTPANIWLDNIYFYKTGGGGGGNYTLNDPIDFEPSGFGADWTWTVFENDTNPPVEIVANPNPSGANTSSTVAKITALQAGQPWVGCETAHGTDFTTFTLDASNAIVRIMVYKSVISDVGLKFVLPSSEALEEIKVANTLINQWEELTFDFSSRIGHPSTIGQDQIVVFPDFDLGGRTSDNVIYFDNIRFSSN